MSVSGNRAFAQWGDVFDDQVVATALLDRLLHHAVVVQIEGASHRLLQRADVAPEAVRTRPIPSAFSSPFRPKQPSTDRSADPALTITEPNAS